jgi:hypothetical protein
MLAKFAGMAESRANMSAKIDLTGYQLKDETERATRDGKWRPHPQKRKSEARWLCLDEHGIAIARGPKEDPS